MLSYNSVIKNEIKHESISVKEIYPVIKINLRGKKREFLTNVGKNLNMILPTEANTSTTSDKLTAIWLSPDEWMIISNELASKDTNKSDLYEMLFNSISKTNLGAVIDVTDQFVQLELKGENVSMKSFQQDLPLILMNLKKKKDQQLRLF